MTEVITIGVDLAKSVFQVHGVDASGKPVIGASFGGARFWPSSRSCRLVWWGWRLVQARIIGRARFRKWAMRCG